MSRFRLPYDGAVYFASPYGERMLNGTKDYHAGIDLVGQENRIIRAPCAGVVGNSTIIADKANRTWEWGNYVRVDTPDGYSVYLCHMRERIAKVGDVVQPGDAVGIEGDTGYSFGCHCHMEVRLGGEPVDPCPLLGIDPEAGVMLHQDPEPADGNTPHTWAADAVRWATENDILRGSDAGGKDYRLHDAATREEMLVFLHRAMMRGK